MRALLDNVPLKLVSVGLASLLWFVIAGDQTSEMGVSAPLELQNFPKDLEVTGEPVDRVEVRLRASPGVIQRIGPADVSAQVDLAGLKEGEHIIHLTEGSIRMPFGVKVVKVTPSLLTLRLERTLQRVVPIRPRVVGQPAPGFEVAEVVSDPGEVRIAGPRSRVERVESAFTEPLSIEGADRAVTDIVNLGLEDPLLRILGTPRVRATIRVHEVEGERTVEVPVDAGGALARPSSVRVTLAGPESLLRSLRPAQVTGRAEAGAAGDTVPVRVELAPSHTGLRVKEIAPPQVALRAARPARRTR